MDQIKQAFQRVKEDIFSLKEEINSLKEEINSLKNSLDNPSNSKSSYINQTNNQLDTSTDRQTISTDSTHPSTDNFPFKPSKPQNLGISTGNGGVPTDRQTNRQTNRQTDFTQENKENSFKNAIDVLNSLDNIKKEIRLKFKALTEQEILVFSTIYQLDEEYGSCDYKAVSQQLNLSESSVRDYVGRLIKKGISVEKHKINNKNIKLTISSDLKKIATLDTILQLREL